MPLPRLLQRNVRIDPERHRLLLAGEPVVVSPVAALVGAIRRYRPPPSEMLPGPAQRLHILNRRFRERSGSSSSETSNWRRERDSNPRRAFDPYTLSRGAPSTTRPSLRLPKTLAHQLVAREARVWPGMRAAMILKPGAGSKAANARYTLRRVRTNSSTEANAASSASGLLPPACAKSGRPPPRPPICAATAPTSSACLHARGLISRHAGDQHHLGRALDGSQHHDGRLESLLELIHRRTQRAGIGAIHAWSRPPSRP